MTNTSTSARKNRIRQKASKKRVANVSNAKTNNPASKLRIPAILYSVQHPFTSPSSHYPDANTADSGLATSILELRGSPYPNNAGYSSTTHSFGFVLPPYPNFTYLAQLASDSNLLTDLNNTGTAYVLPWVGTTGSSMSEPPRVPNMGALLGTTGVGLRRSKIRCTGIGIRIVYEGTELQRSGKVIAGLVPMNSPGRVTTTTGTRISAGAAALASVYNENISPVDLKQQAVTYTEQRVSDTPVEFRWAPSGTPTYQLATETSDRFGTAAGVQPTQDTIWCSPANDYGCQSGQNALIVMVVGDTTPVARAVGNPFSVSIKWKWEVIPDDVTSVAYSLTSSPASSQLMDLTLNAFTKMTVGTQQGNGNTTR